MEKSGNYEFAARHAGILKKKADFRSVADGRAHASVGG
jgi:hypothetical protein